MTERATDDEDEHLPIKTDLEDQVPMLAAEITVSQNLPAECTIRFVR